MKIRCAWILTGVAFFCAGVPVAQSAAAFPERPLRLIVPFAPGGGSDITARLVAEKLAPLIGQPIVVDNRGGGGGIVGTQAVARANPDGYTMLWGTSSGLVINPLLSKDLPYNVGRDFAAVSMISVNSLLLVVNNSLPVNSVKELIAAARAKPGAFSYATPGYGTPVHLAMELFKSMTGTDIVHVPYKGAGPALVDLIAGQVHMKFNGSAAVLPLIKSGKLRALAIGDARRSRIVPEIPTMIEAGVPGFEATTWYGVFVPAGTPRPVVGLLNGRVVKMLGDPEIARRLADDGSEPRATTPEGMKTYMREEAERWKRAIKYAPPSS